VTDKEVGSRQTDDSEQCPSVTLSIGDTYNVNSMGARTESCATSDVHAVKEECSVVMPMIDERLDANDLSQSRTRSPTPNSSAARVYRME